MQVWLVYDNIIAVQGGATGFDTGNWEELSSTTPRQTAWLLLSFSAFPACYWAVGEVRWRIKYILIHFCRKWYCINSWRMKIKMAKVAVNSCRVCPLTKWNRERRDEPAVTSLQIINGQKNWFTRNDVCAAELMNLCSPALPASSQSGLADMPLLGHSF